MAQDKDKKGIARVIQILVHKNKLENWWHLSLIEIFDILWILYIRLNIYIFFLNLSGISRFIFWYLYKNRIIAITINIDIIMYDR